MRRRNAADLARLSLALALVAIALSAWVWKAGAPLPGDEWLLLRLQSSDALHRNEFHSLGRGTGTFSPYPHFL